MRTITKLLVTNSEARKLVTDLSVIGRDLLSRGAAKAAGNIAPSPEELAGVDESTKRDEFVEDDVPNTEEVRATASETKETTIETTKDAARAAAADATDAVASSSDDEIEGEKKKSLFSRLSVCFPPSKQTHSHAL